MLHNFLGAFSSYGSGAIPPPPYYISGGNRSEVPYTYTTIVTSTQHVRQCSILVKSPAHASLLNPKVNFSNWTALANGGESTSSLFPFYLRAALEYPLGTRKRLYFNGGNTDIEQFMSLGLDVETALDPDAPDLIIPPNSDYWIRIYQNYTNLDGTPYSGTQYNHLLNQLLAPNRNECNMSGSDPNDDRTVVGNMTSVAGISQSYGFTMIRAQPL